MTSNGKTPIEAVSGGVAEGQRVCEFCGQPLIGRRTRFCSRLCSRHAWEAIGKAQRAVALAEEQAAERADARRQLARLHARREALAGDASGASDSTIGAELASIASQARAAIARLRETAEGTAA
jgi:cell division protein FtsB